MKRLWAAAPLLVGYVLLSEAVFAAAGKHAAFVGTWAIDAGKSQVTEARDVTLTIEFSGEIMKFATTVKKGDASVTSQFSCDTANGTECPFEEAGHKSKASVYFNGPVINIWKSDGPVGDVAAQWKIELSSDGKVLTATISHLDPAGKDEVLVFEKKSDAT